MADWMLYLLKVSCFHAMLVLFYLVFLRRLTFYHFNRWFLIGGLMLGFLLPIIQVPNEPIQKVNEEFVEIMGPGLIAEPITQQTLEAHAFQVNWYAVIVLFYALGVLILVQRYLTNYLKIRKFKYGYELINRIGAIEVFRTPFAQPFSFFKSVFIPAKVEKTQELDLVMAHELRHVEFGHSYDRMLVDFIIVLLWFNPFIYLLRKCLIEVHEYQVDAAVVGNPQAKIAYQMSLVSLAGGGFSGPVSFFNFSTIKRRIQMMNRNKSNKMSLVSLALLIPMIGTLVVLFSFEMKAPEKSVTEVFELPKKVSAAEVAGEKPSIFPVATTTGKVKVTSTFGMRNDPFSGDQKAHHGMDISAKTGTPVIATAAGEVIEVEYQPNGYGKYVVIKHDETYQTKYAQMSSQEVSVGDQVKKGDVIGKVGSSGRSTAPHLHYEVRKNGKPVDPVGYISDYKFSQETVVKSQALAKAQQEQKEAVERKAVLAKMNAEERKEYEAKQAQLVAVEEQMRVQEIARLEAEEQLKLSESQLEQNERQMRLQEEQLRKQQLQNLQELPEIMEIPPTPEDPAEIMEVEPTKPVELEIGLESGGKDKIKSKEKSKDKKKEKSKDKQKDQ